MVRKRELPYVRRPVIQDRCIEIESFLVRCQCRWKEKRDEEAKERD
jgi:hypothetical protein